MSTSLIHHAHVIRGVKHIRTEREKGSTIFEAEVIRAIENCPVRGNGETVHSFEAQTPSLAPSGVIINWDQPFLFPVAGPKKV